MSYQFTDTNPTVFVEFVNITMCGLFIFLLQVNSVFLDELTSVMPFHYVGNLVVGTETEL